MSALTKAFSTSIGQKLLVGLTGLALVGFVVAHLLGNLTVFATADVTLPDGTTAETNGINVYAEGLHGIPGFTLIELGLLAMFIIHIAMVIRLIASNRAAAGGSRYAVSASKRETGGLRALASRTMAASGILTLLFLVVHLADIRLKRSEITESASGGLPPDLHAHLAGLFEAEWRVALYVIGSLLVAWHIFHGFQSATRSLGLNHPKYTPALIKLGGALAVLLGLGFAALPIYFVVG